MINPKNFFRKGIVWAMSILCLMAGSLSLAKENPSITAAVPSFLDDLLPAQLERYHIPGAVVAVVKDGAPVAVKGYGVADLESGRPVFADQTLFRIASITKLFTWTAVMQQEERGRLDLDTDINRYLQGLKVPVKFAKPITMKHLMTHTAGFEDVGIGTARYTNPGPDFLRAYLENHLPSRVRPPGEMVMYSNHGAALAGLIVSNLSGMTYEDYVEREIFEPLGMNRTTVRQPVPEKLQADLARSYIFVAGKFRPTTFTVDLLAPAGGASATANEMAAFMIAHLQDGVYGNSRILTPPTVDRMHRTAFTLAPGLPGWAYGFQEMSLKGRRVLFHDGSFQGYLSLLALIPEERLGLFVAYNSSGGGEAIDELLTGFADRFLPEKPGSPKEENVSMDSKLKTIAPKDISGFYIPARRPYTTIEKLTRQVTVESASVDPSGAISFLGRTWRPLGNGLYQDPSGDLLAALTDRRGRVGGLAIGTYAFDRLPWFNLPWFHVTLALVSLGILLSSLFIWPMGARARRGRGDGAILKLLPAAQWVAGAASVLFLSAILGIGFVLFGAPLFYGVPSSLFVLSLLPVGGAILGLVTVVFMVLLWLKREGRLASRVYYTLVTVAILIVVFLCWQYGILGPHLG